MKTIIAGSRTIKNQDDVNLAIALSGFGISEVVSGCQRTLGEDGMLYGADFFGEVWANSHGIPVQPFPAKWEILGKSAGPIRNQEMANYADALIAIWDGKSRGTKDMIDKATKKGLKVFIYKV